MPSWPSATPTALAAIDDGAGSGTGGRVAAGADAADVVDHDRGGVRAQRPSSLPRAGRPPPRRGGARRSGAGPRRAGRGSAASALRRSCGCAAAGSAGRLPSPGAGRADPRGRAGAGRSPRGRSGSRPACRVVGVRAVEQCELLQHLAEVAGLQRGFQRIGRRALVGADERGAERLLGVCQVDARGGQHDLVLMDAVLGLREAQARAVRRARPRARGAGRRSASPARHAWPALARRRCDRPAREPPRPGAVPAQMTPSRLVLRPRSITLSRRPLARRGA